MALHKRAVTIRVTRRFRASPQTVFDAWLDPATARQFLFATPRGCMVRADMDARVGGKFVLTDRRDGENVEHLGEYLEIDRPRRIEFAFSVPMFLQHVSRVIVEILPRDRACALLLTQEGVYPEYASRSEAGWVTTLNRLAEVLGEGNAGPF